MQYLNRTQEPLSLFHVVFWITHIVSADSASPVTWSFKEVWIEIRNLANLLLCFQRCKDIYGNELNSIIMKLLFQTLDFQGIKK